MHKAFKSVRKNRGAAGIDRQSIAMFEANLEQNLAALMKDLKGGNFVPKPVRRTYSPWQCWYVTGPPVRAASGLVRSQIV